MARKRFLTDDRGMVAVYFAVATLPVLAAIGLALDYGGRINGDARLQDAVDFGALAAASALDANSSISAQDAASTAVYGNASSRALVINSVSVSKPTGNTVQVTATATRTAIFGKVFGATSQTLKASSTAAFGQYKTPLYEIALVLDNSGSMQSKNKIGKLQSAAKTFVDQVALSSPGSKISIIPYTRYVNIGLTNSAAAWLRWDLDSHSNGPWDGCITDRDKPYATSNSVPVIGVLETLVPARTCSTNQDVQAMVGLTTDYSKIKQIIDGMVINNGGTNIPLAMDYGYISLTPNSILGGGGAAFNSSSVKKVVVLMTDGTNHLNRWADDQQTMDVMTLDICNSMKNSGIYVFTVGIEDGDLVSHNLLTACASATGYVNIVDSDHTAAAFGNISSSLPMVKKPISLVR